MELRTLKRPLRPNVALAIDGGGIKGVMVARALMLLEEAIGQPLPVFVRLTAGTSTGAIIAGAIARGLEAAVIYDLYTRLGPAIFRKTWRTLPLVKLLVPYQYDSQPLSDALAEQLGDITLGDLHEERRSFNMVITATDVYASRTRFIKLYKSRYRDWKLRDAVMASSIVPTIFPIYPHPYATPTDPAPPDEAWIPEPRAWIDGGVGSYSNPCFLAAYEIAFCLAQQGWSLGNTTLISIGTGKDPTNEVWAERTNGFRRNPQKFLGPEWAFPTVDTFLQDANLQQIRLVKHFFVDSVIARTGDPNQALDFRRFNVAFDQPIAMDQAESIPALADYGTKLGQMILDDVQENVGQYTCGEAAQAFSLPVE